MESILKQAREKDMIAVVNAYTKRCYGRFTSVAAARNYMRNMLLKEPTHPVKGTFDFAGDCIWAYDARGTEVV